MRIKNLELWLAFLAIAMITVVYVGVVAQTEVPAASGLFGHLLGVFGFVLMLMTEVLYSLRKRYQYARWGKMKNWLSFHIITGLVGPFMVLLHSSWKFNGLAGILMLMTVIIVISGFIGRYFYTAIPRSVDGVEIQTEQLHHLLEQNQDKLEEWRQSQPKLYQQVEGMFSQGGKSSIQRRGLAREWENVIALQVDEDRRVLENMRLVWERQINLNRQMAQLANARKLLAVWHTVHIPLGVAMFTIAFIHIGATLYYITLLR